VDILQETRSSTLDTDTYYRLDCFGVCTRIYNVTILLRAGVMTGAVAVLIAYFTKSITSYKMSIFYSLIQREIGGELAFGSAFLYLLAFNVGLGVLAWLTVFVEPLSAGSGTQYLF
jgi:hypothetical protein